MDYILLRPAPPRGAIAIVTFAGWDAVDAGDAASRGSWGDVCLRAGRICASTATGKETADLRMERPLDSVTDDQVKTRSAYSLEAPCPIRLGTVILVIGSFAMATRKQPKKHRMRNVGQSLGASESPDAL